MPFLNQRAELFSLQHVSSGNKINFFYNPIFTSDLYHIVRKNLKINVMDAPVFIADLGISESESEIKLEFKRLPQEMIDRFNSEYNRQPSDMLIYNTYYLINHKGDKWEVRWKDFKPQYKLTKCMLNYIINSKGDLVLAPSRITQDEQKADYYDCILEFFVVKKY